MMNSLFSGNRNSLLAWPWLYPNKKQDQPVFSPMPFEGGMAGSKGAPVMAGGMPYPAQPGIAPQAPMTGHGGMVGGPGPIAYQQPYRGSGGMRYPGNMAIRNKY